MSQLKNIEIAELADAWGKIEYKIAAQDEARAAAIEPLTESYNSQVEEVSRSYDRRIAKLRADQVAIEQQVLPVLQKRKADTVISGELAEAVRKTETKVGPRVIIFEKFWKKARGLGQAAIDCINVQVGPAEKLLGKKTIDAISTKDSKTGTTVELRLKAEEV